VQTPPPAGDISPTLALGSLAGIHSVTFSVSGITGNCPGCEGVGGPLHHVDGTVNGVPDLTAPLNSLIGAWINLTDISLSQSFEIGSGGTFVVPTGADELFLGSMDGYQWNNNEGQSVVDLETHRDVPEPFTLSLFGAGLAGAAAMRRRKKV
jgi:PEP-CTERM motif